jgi:hypothetical protein
MDHEDAGVGRVMSPIVWLFFDLSVQMETGHIVEDRSKRGCRHSVTRGRVGRVGGGERMAHPGAQVVKLSPGRFSQNLGLGKLD